MQAGVIAVYDQEPEYAMRLSDYISRQGRFPVGVACYAEEEALREAVRAGQVRMVIAGQMKEALTEDSLPVIHLTEEKTCQAMAVYKYQPAGKLLQLIEEVGQEIMPLSETRTVAAAEIRGVYAPSGGCLKTTLALLMGVLLAEREKVLYLNLEAHSGFRVLMDCQYPADLSDLLAMMRQGEDVVEKLPGMLQSFEGLSYLAPVVWPEDIYETKPQEWRDLIGRLAGSGRFDQMILDVGLDFPCPEELLMCCGRVYRPEKPDAISRAKDAEYDRYLTASSRGELLSRMVPVPLGEIAGLGGCRSLDQWRRWEGLVPVVRKILWEEGQTHE